MGLLRRTQPLGRGALCLHTRRLTAHPSVPSSPGSECPDGGSEIISVMPPLKPLPAESPSADEHAEPALPLCLSHYEVYDPGTCLVVQGLRLCAPNTGGPGFDSCSGSQIPHAETKRSHAITKDSECHN